MMCHTRARVESCHERDVHRAQHDAILAGFRSWVFKKFYHIESYGIYMEY